MKPKEFNWNPRFQHRGIKPEDAHKAFEEIRSEAGSLTPRAVVDAAKPKEHPLHPAFEWRDKVAADKYRQGQARTMVASLEVVYEQGPKEPTRYLTLETRGEKNTGDTKYTETHILLQDRDSRNDLLLNALRELQAFRKKYALLSELAGLIPVLDQQIEDLRSAVGED